jgi:hypothetical protein
MNAPNGKLIVGTHERVYGVAQIDPASTLTDVLYIGETEIDWNSQESVEGPDGREFVDEDGMYWTERALRGAS